MATKKAVKKVVKKPAKKPASKTEPRVSIARIDFERYVENERQAAIAKFINVNKIELPCADRFDNVQHFRGEEAIPVEKPSILEEANAIIYGDREQMYGDPGRNLRAIADYWTVHLRHKYGAPIELTTDDVCQMMISVKQARLLHNPEHRDSQVDTAGYQALMNRVQPTF